MNKGLSISNLINAISNEMPSHLNEYDKFKLPVSVVGPGSYYIVGVSYDSDNEEMIIKVESY